MTLKDYSKDSRQVIKESNKMNKQDQDILAAILSVTERAKKEIEKLPEHADRKKVSLNALSAVDSIVRVALTLIEKDRI